LADTSALRFQFKVLRGCPQLVDQSLDIGAHEEFNACRTLTKDEFFYSQYVCRREKSIPAPSDCEPAARTSIDCGIQPPVINACRSMDHQSGGSFNAIWASNA